MKPYPTTAPTEYKVDGGYAGGTIRPSDLACQLFKENIPGAELACYMLRRFGWPNEGSDPHKNFMSWTLTTSIPGLYLCVTPYLAEQAGPLKSYGKPGDTLHYCGNLHFAVRFTREVEQKMERDTGRERFFHRRKDNVLKWWWKEGRKKYSIGVAIVDDPEEKLVVALSEPRNGTILGLFERKPEHKKQGVSNNLSKWIRKYPWIPWRINDWRKEVLKHKLPEMTKREMACRKNRFARQCETALKRTMLDLLRTTNVRDVNINIFGYQDGRTSKTTRPVVKGHVEPWGGVGYTPEYFYSKAGRADYAKELKARKQP